MKRECDCVEFKENMPKLDNVTTYSFLHGVPLGSGFLYFKHCPWCGMRLKEMDDATTPLSDKERE